jgi:NAD(P)-dependent dehydrogenase (short-subunit alcohol dehydrogenase family)
MKIVIVTGSSRGLGASTAVECPRKGMGVMVTYNSNPEKAEEVVKTIVQSGGRAMALKLDVGNVSAFPPFRDAVAAQLQAVWGRGDFDCLVNNALRRVGEPEEIGGVVASLLSSENRWSNAQNIKAAGGYVI